ncbi:MAG: hypothetical protein AAGM84_04470 [Pseudomonadota bacterium]
MTTLTRTALWRGLTFFACVFRTYAAQNHAPLPKPDPNVARDIGLSEAALERLHRRWPYETIRHPWL